MKNSGELMISSEEACVISSICSSTNAGISRVIAKMYCEYGHGVVNGLICSMSAFATHNMPTTVDGNEEKIVKKLLELGSQFPDETESCVSRRHSKAEHTDTFREMLLRMNIFGPEDPERIKRITDDPDSFFTEKDRETLRKLDSAFR